MANFIIEDIKSTFRNKSNGLAQLILINVGIFVIVNIIRAIILIAGGSSFGFIKWISLPASLITYITRPWTMVSYMFLHEGFLHILFNMLWLYWMGKLFHEYLGNKKLISTYLLGGLAGGALFVLSYNLVNIIAPGSPSFYMGAQLLGASAGVMAIVVGTATLLPNHSINLLFIGPVRLKYVALGALLLTTVLNFQDNTGGKIAHIGGALYGYFYVRQLQKGKDIAAVFNALMDNLFSIFKPQKKQPKMKVKHKRPKSDEQFKKDKKKQQDRVNAILDKISKSGYDSLTKEEKEFLFKVSSDR